jgi:hypothetical protein
VDVIYEESALGGCVLDLIPIPETRMANVMRDLLGNLISQSIYNAGQSEIDKGCAAGACDVLALRRIELVRCVYVRPLFVERLPERPMYGTGFAA